MLQAQLRVAAAGHLQNRLLAACLLLNYFLQTTNPQLVQDPYLKTFAEQQVLRKIYDVKKGSRPKLHPDWKTRLGTGNMYVVSDGTGCRCEVGAVALLLLLTLLCNNTPSLAAVMNCNVMAL
jgi:hypothetical protein